MIILMIEIKQKYKYQYLIEILIYMKVLIQMIKKITIFKILIKII